MDWSESALRVLALLESKDIKDRGALSASTQDLVALRYIASPAIMRRLQVLERSRWNLSRSRAEREFKNMIRTLMETPTPANFKTIKRRAERWLERWSFMAYRRGMAAAGVGDRKLTDADVQWLSGKWMPTELAFMKRLLRDARFERISTLRALQRAKWFANSLDSVFWAGLASSYPSKGTRIRWKLSRAEHCPDCISLDAQSRRQPFTIRTLPTTPRAGHTRCKANCKCRLEIVFIPKEASKRVKRLLGRESEEETPEVFLGA